MDLKNIFKKLVLLELFLFFSLLAMVFFELEDESVRAFNDEHMVVTYALGYTALAQIVIYPISLYLLYTFKKYGKELYVFLFIFYLLWLSLNGNYAMGVIEQVITPIYYSVQGAILALLFFSPIKDEFNKKKTQGE